MTSQPAIFDIKVYRGYDWFYQIRLQNEADDGSITPLDLTGGEIASTAWDQSRTIKYADFNVEYISRTGGIFKISLTDDQTLNFPSVLYYDVRLKNSGDKKTPYIIGKITVNQGYTR